MSFNWLDYLKLSDDLLNSRPATEAKNRCSISRAYYSIFCFTRNFLKDEGILLPNKSQHEALFRLYKFDKNMNNMNISIGTDLERLRDLRTEADYYDTFTSGNLEKQNDYAIKLAKGIEVKVKSNKKNLPVD